ncbi:multidrug resistance protein, partial [Aureobasidium pullulans]
ARELSFRAILRQEAKFFDQKENSTGSLLSFLSSETADLAGISGVVLGTIFQVTVTLIVGYVVSLAVGWKLALVCISTVPVLLGSGFFRVRLLAHFQENQAIVHQASTTFACEAVGVIRTVAAQTREKDVGDQYHTMLDNHGKQNLYAILKATLLYAASQSLIFLCIALGLWYGSGLIADREYSIFQFFLCFSAVIFGSQAAGTIFSFAPDTSKAQRASANLHKLLGSVPEIDPSSDTGKKLRDLKGTIHLKGVHFTYPSRQETPILRGVDLKVEAGQLVALVGTSGCGKSTIVSLVERFYDPQEGSVYIDGEELRTLHVATFRNHLALVSQEATLYSGTIRANLLLGTQTSDDSILEEDIIDACKDANIYGFITSLPEGSETVVGSRGSMLSGGQRQRIAIARALIRNPKILLLDEATSNMDAESEEIVQAALDKAASGRTTILVAHRLSTVRQADVIFVLDAGRIVEQGTHETLLSKKGCYYEMVHAQELDQDTGRKITHLFT